MRIGSRRSALALAQARLVAELLGSGRPGSYEIVPMATRGDREPAPQEERGGSGGDRGMAGMGRVAAGGDKSRWVAELEQALLDGRIDLAVHSAKDVPGELTEGLALRGAPGRAGAEDVLCGARGLDQLPAGARVGTSSIRRMAQLRAAREDLEVVAIRGNVDTRLSKLASSEEDLQAIVLARAGLQRLGRESEIGGMLELERFLPAPGQGILALEGRAGDAGVSEALAAITDASTFACLLCERALARELEASCHTPLGAHAEPAGEGRLRLRAWVGLPDGSEWIGDDLHGDAADPERLGREVAARMRLSGAGGLLKRAEQMAVA